MGRDDWTLGRVDDFDLLIELIAHALADKETSMLRVAHDQAVARQRQKLTAD